MAFTVNKRSLLILETLSTAARFNTPFDLALAKLLQPQSRRLVLNIFGNPYMAGILAWPLSPQRLFEKDLHHAIRELQNGNSLGDAMGQLADHLPLDVRMGIEQADEQGKLEQFLPTALKSMNIELNEPSHGTRFILSASISAFFASLVFVGLFTRIILPRFANLLSVMAIDTYPAYGNRLNLLGKYIGSAACVVPLIAVWYFLSHYATRTANRYKWARDINDHKAAWFTHVTGSIFSPRVTRLRAELEVFRIMACWLGLAVPFPEALHMAQQITHHLGLRKKLQTIRDNIEKGTPWHLAWEHADIGDSMTSWLLSNAANREDPAHGYIECTRISTNRLSTYLKRRRRITIAACFLCYAGITCFFSLYIVHGLAKMIESLAN